MHPAKFTPAVVDVILERLGDRGGTLLDPFAGTGLQLARFVAPRRRVIGVEIEQPWVDEGNLMMLGTPAEGILRQGDSTCLDLRARSVSTIVTSCAYGNRFADRHRARDTSDRRSYTHDIRNTTGDLDYELAPTNTGRWHEHEAEYWDLHERVWSEVTRVAKPGTLLFLNVSDFERTRKVGGVKIAERVPVTFLHLDTLINLGWDWTWGTMVPTPRMRRGQNGDRRVDGEWVHELRRA